MRWTLHFSLPNSSLYLHVRCRFIPRSNSAFQQLTDFALQPFGIAFAFQESSLYSWLLLRRFVAMCVRSKAGSNSHLTINWFYRSRCLIVLFGCQRKTNVIFIRIYCNQLLKEQHGSKRRYSVQDLYSRETRLHQLLETNIRAKQLGRERGEVPRRAT